MVTFCFSHFFSTTWIPSSVVNLWRSAPMKIGTIKWTNFIKKSRKKFHWLTKKNYKKCFFYFKIPLLIIIKKIKLVIEWYLIKLLFLGIEAVLHNVALQLQIRTSAPPKEMELQRFKAGPSPHRRLSTEKKKIGFRQDYGWQLIFMIKTFFKIEFSYLKNSFALHQTFFSNSMYWYVFRSPTFLAYAFKNHDVLADAVFTSIFRSLLSVVNLISVWVKMTKMSFFLAIGSLKIGVWKISRWLHKNWFGDIFVLQADFPWQLHYKRDKKSTYDKSKRS